ncbi:MAG: hypothetical protein IH588_16120 [Anaerolineales bacterium]|nr:hypothetical protein [Anaerolineales bacterium]
MTRKTNFLLFSITTITSLLIASCGANTSTGDATAVIQTSVAQTVAAQNTLQVPDTETPSAAAIPTKTPFQQLTPLAPLASPSPTFPVNSSYSQCASASLKSENIVDGTVFKPGEQFTKTWEITNTSTCVWDTNYKIIFWDGDLLGGGYVYNLPQVVGPGQTLPISLVLIAPATDGTYRSEWKLQTPDNNNFGVGYLNSAFYTEIAVSSAQKPKYGIASVVTSYTRDPKTGCPANTLITVYATVATTGPLEFTYNWNQSDGNNSSSKGYFMESATTKTFTREWKFGRANTQGPKWIAFVITEPIKQKYQVDFEFVCP